MGMHGSALRGVRIHGNSGEFFFSLTCINMYVWNWLTSGGKRLQLVHFCSVLFKDIQGYTAMFEPTGWKPNQRFARFWNECDTVGWVGWSRVGWGVWAVIANGFTMQKTWQALKCLKKGIGKSDIYCDDVYVMVQFECTVHAQRIFDAKEGRKGLFDAGLTDDPNWTCYIFDMLKL